MNQWDEAAFYNFAACVEHSTSEKQGNKCNYIC